MDYLLSIDGGGTKTEFCLADKKGSVLHSFQVGSSNFKSVGLEEAANNLKQGFSELWNQHQISIEDLAFIVLGIAGIDSQQDHEKISKIIQSFGFAPDQFYLTNDGVLAYYTCAVEPGMAVISGTGSIVLSINADKKISRLGGWGYPFSDVGSGYWIGAKALSLLLSHTDGCYGHYPLFDAIQKHLGAETMSDMPYLITQITDFQSIAEITEIVIREAQKEDELSMMILEEGADHLAALVQSLWRRESFSREQEVSIVFSGGAFNNQIYSNLLRFSILRRIKPKERAILRFILNDTMPAKGGITLAKILIAQ